MKSLAVLLSLFFVFFLMSSVFGGTIVPQLAEQLDQASESDFIVVGIEMADKFDVTGLDRDLKVRRATRQQRHYEVITAAQEWAAYSQAELLTIMDQKIEEGTVLNYKAYWISNTVFAEVQKAVVYELKDIPSVDLIHPNYEAELIEPVPQGSKSVPGLRGVENGLQAINAPECWTIGITGEGRLVANLDTGVDGNHPALANRWRGLHEPADECWRGPGSFPTPSGDHGTHVMGTECGLGEATGDTIGVAWGAEWIAADTQNWDVSWLNGCFEWFADPDGDPQTVDDVPDAVNNSWRFFESCQQDLFNSAIEVCEAGGCAVIFAAGNEGSSPETIGNPPNQILTPYTVFSVGAVNGNESPPYPIAGFSSRGPSDCDHETIKPEVAAPGVGVRSSVPGGGYDQMGGTSMASPHVAGVCALMRQVDPNLEVDVMKEILMITAVDQGPPGEDNTFGWGVIDAYAAVMETFARLSAFEGIVTDSENGNPLRETRIYVEDTSFETISDVTGFYHLSAEPGTYFLSAERFGYYNLLSEASYTITSQETLVVDIQLEPRPQGILSGIVTDVHGTPIPYAQFTPLDVPVDPFYTELNGNYQVSLPGDYDYTFWLYAPDHDPQEITVSVPASGNVTQDVEMVFVQSFEVTNGEFGLSPGFNEWEHGIPQESGGPAFAYSGESVWGTDLDGEYDPLRNYHLITRPFRMGISEEPRMVIYTWYDMSDGWDGGNVSISIDNGDTWEILYPDGGYPDNSVAAIVGQPGFTGTSDGWQRVEFPLTEYLNERIRFRFRFASSNDTDPGWFIDNFTIYGAIDFYTDIDDFATEKITTPLRYDLTQNVPNPFNPFTLMSYQIPVSSHVSLKVYDSSGKLIRTLVQQEQPAGTYSVEWNGKADNGRPVPSGIYFYSLNSNDYSQSRRMVLLK